MNHCVWLLFIDLNGIGITTVFNWGKKTFRLTWLELVFIFHLKCQWLNDGGALFSLFHGNVILHVLIWEKANNWISNAIPGCCVICYENRKWPWKGCIVKDFRCCRNIHSLNINLSEWIIHFHYTHVMAAGVAASTSLALVSAILIWIDK